MTHWEFAWLTGNLHASLGVCMTHTESAKLTGVHKTHLESAWLTGSPSDSLGVFLPHWEPV